jgi:hypothetical protein
MEERIEDNHASFQREWNDRLENEIEDYLYEEQKDIPLENSEFEKG